MGNFTILGYVPELPGFGMTLNINVDLALNIACDGHVIHLFIGNI